MFLTSNNVRDLGDALKRRCLHLHIPLPDAQLEERIVATRVPGVEARLNRELVAFVQGLRGLELRKVAVDLRDRRLGPGADAAARRRARAPIWCARP